MKIFLIGLLFFINIAFASNLSGKYLCNGYDTKDGSYKDDYVTLTTINKHSYPDKDLYSYNFELRDTKGILQYSGFAASNGDNLSIYFENINKNDPKTKEDKGVGIAVVQKNTTRDANGKFDKNITFSKFYFEPTYSSDGSENCKKI